MPSCPSSPCLLPTLRTGYRILYAEVSSQWLHAKLHALSQVLGLSSRTFIQCFWSAWELQALSSSCFGWHHPRFADTKLLETLANSRSCQRYRVDTQASDRGCWSGQSQHWQTLPCSQCCTNGSWAHTRLVASHLHSLPGQVAGALCFLLVCRDWSCGWESCGCARGLSFIVLSFDSP